ncbi:MAG: hypothetical protein HQM11_15430 [SAR324 cluster bacterium]|nr:hypothetical protein [SAR324 cluster bacterium]
MMRHWIAGFILVLAITTNAEAKDNKAVLEVTRCATDISSLLKKEMNVRLVKMDRDFLQAEGSFVNYRVPFLQQTSYVLAACGEPSIKALDIKIYDATGNLVAKNEKSGNRPMVKFQPPSTSVFILKILASQGMGNYAFILMSQ